MHATTRAPVAVIGVGNVLLGDDGIGPCVARLLEGRLPGVDVLDCGTAGLDVSAEVLDRRIVVFVDAVDGTRAGHEPGTVVVLGHDVLTTGGPTGPRMSPHEPGVRDALAIADLVDRAPRVALLVGIVPATTEMGTTLTPAVAAAAVPAANRVISELAALGIVHPTLREADVGVVEGFFGA